MVVPVNQNFGNFWVVEQWEHGPEEMPSRLMVNVFDLHGKAHAISDENGRDSRSLGLLTGEFGGRYTGAQKNPSGLRNFRFFGGRRTCL